MKDIFKMLEDALTDNYQQGLLEAEKNPEKKGYAQGLKQALETVRSIKTECEMSAPSPVSSDQAKAPDNPKLYCLSADQVCALHLNTFDEEKSKDYSLDELVEAAFRFENELLATLGDPNTVPIDAYETLNEQKLLNIIVTAAEKIVQMQQNE